MNLNASSFKVLHSSLNEFPHKLLPMWMILFLSQRIFQIQNFNWACPNNILIRFWKEYIVKRCHFYSFFLQPQNIFKSHISNLKIYIGMHVMPHNSITCNNMDSMLIWNWCNFNKEILFLMIPYNLLLF